MEDESRSKDEMQSAIDSERQLRSSPSHLKRERVAENSQTSAIFATNNVAGAAGHEDEASGIGNGPYRQPLVTNASIVFHPDQLLIDESSDMRNTVGGPFQAQRGLFAPYWMRPVETAVITGIATAIALIHFSKPSLLALSWLGIALFCTGNAVVALSCALFREGLFARCSTLNNERSPNAALWWQEPLIRGAVVLIATLITTAFHLAFVLTYFEPLTLVLFSFFVSAFALCAFSLDSIQRVAFEWFRPLR